MIYFFTGFATGAVTALISCVCLYKAKTKAETKTAPSAEEIRLNAEKEARAKVLAELDRQWNNMLNYTGKEQRG